MNGSVTVRAPAKINLLLDIIGKGADGYHFLRTVMQTVSLYDKITVRQENEAGIRIYCDKENIPTDKTNLAYKAAEAFFNYTRLQGHGLGITLKKSIPSQAGLAGGSADAAGVLIGLNVLFEAGLSYEELKGIGLTLGADVPFCIRGGTALAEGIGEIITPLPDISDDCVFLIVKPPIGCSTPAVFKAYDEIEAPVHPDFDGLIAAAAAGNTENFAPLCSNILEQAVSIPEIEKIKNTMLLNGAAGASMTGSGSAVFGIFEKKKAADSCADLFPEEYFTAVCKAALNGAETC